MDGGVGDRIGEVRSGDVGDLRDDLAKDLGNSKTEDAGSRLHEQARVRTDPEGPMKEDGRFVLIVEVHLELAACDGGDVDESGLRRSIGRSHARSKRWYRREASMRECIRISAAAPDRPPTIRFVS